MGPGAAVEPNLRELDEQQVNDNHSKQEEEGRRQGCEPQHAGKGRERQDGTDQAAPVGTSSIGRLGRLRKNGPGGCG